MRAHVYPGQFVVIHQKINDGDVGIRTSPRLALVQQVNRGTLVVAERASATGLAAIVCHGTSGSEGKYWYEYTRMDVDSPDAPRYLGTSLDIERLETQEGKQIQVPRFIED